MERRRKSKALFFVIALLTSGCAAIQPPDASGPGSAGPPYPVVFTEQPKTREAAVIALNRVAQRNGPIDQPGLHLDPLTATIKSLPVSNAPLYLPKVGGAAEMTEEETREALRRFINEWRTLIGANPSHLSLVERVDQPDRTKIARYEQRLFRYPLRGGYGKLEIQFTADRRLINVVSSCLPDAERLQAALANITPRVNLEEAIKKLRTEAIKYTDSMGNPHTHQLSANSEVNPGELVTYALVSNQKDSLELHIAWEVGITNAPFKNIYLDAYRNEIIAVR